MLTCINHMLNIQKLLKIQKGPGSQRELWESRRVSVTETLA